MVYVDTDGTRYGVPWDQRYPPLETHRWSRWRRKDSLHSWWEHFVINMAPGLRLHHAACRWAIKRAMKRHMRQL